MTMAMKEGLGVVIVVDDGKKMSDEEEAIVTSTTDGEFKPIVGTPAIPKPPPLERSKAISIFNINIHESDINGYPTRNMKPERYHFDANGTLIKSNIERPPPPPTKPTKPEKIDHSPTLSDLTRLEECIFNHDVFRIKFLSVVKADPSAPNNRKKWRTRRLRALQYCWDILKWRPSINGKRVLIEGGRNGDVVNVYKPVW